MTESEWHDPMSTSGTSDGASSASASVGSGFTGGASLARDDDDEHHQAFSREESPELEHTVTELIGNGAGAGPSTGNGSTYGNNSSVRRVFNDGMQISVGEPHKVMEGKAAFITYLVTSDRPGMDAERVRRRFSEFVKLYHQLVAEFPAAAVPPLPDHSRLEYLAGDRFSPAFTHKRAASLARFLFRLTQHPDLRCSRTLAAFLAPNARGNGSLPGSVQSSPDSMLDLLSDSLVNAFTKVKYQSKEMIEARERADRFEQSIATIDKAVNRLTKHQGNLHSDLNDMHKQATRLAKLDPEVAPEFEELAATAAALANAFSSLHGGIDAQFAGALRDMAHYVQALKQMLKQREQKQIDYEALVEYLKRTEHEYSSVHQGTAASTPSSYLRTKVNDLRGVDKEQSRLAREQKLGSRIEALTQEVDRAKQMSGQFEEIAKREVAVFEATEALEIKACLGGLADAHIEFYQRALDDCKRIEAEL